VILMQLATVSIVLPRFFSSSHYSFAGTQGIVRNHMIYVSESGLLTIAGGKWTTYREMAKETVDRACEIYGFSRLFLRDHSP